VSLQLNPVIGRELKERVRGLRAFIALTVFVIVLVLTAFFVYESSKDSGYAAFDIERQTRIGRDLFEWVLLVMTGLVLFFVPGLTAGAVAGERERQTLQPLQVTLLRPRSILIGKVIAAVAYLVLLIVASLPLMAMCSLLGGVRVVDIVRGTLAVILTAIALSAMVVCISTFAKRVQTASVLAYGFTALLLACGPLAYGMASVIDARSPQDPTQAPAVLLAVSPIVMVADLTASRTLTGDGPLTAVRRELEQVKSSNDGWFTWFADGGVIQQPGFNPGPVNDPTVDALGRGTPAWALALTWLAAISAGLFVLATRRLRTPAEVER
jgi:ABC-type transport system involved in multi-copper enzyme maturation permease subunit